ncbi:MAG TPA: S-layer homology domain-containing protein [Symbiobacteriaceae bacterium]|nr:S-layer homology domain-containing protein [Symbiobacteriaceae bacterium]
MTIRKWTAALTLAAVVAMAGTAMAAPTVPGAVYSDQQAAGTNKPVQQVQQELQQAGIQDVKPTDWFAGSVTVLVQSGLLKPAANGDFKPEAKVTGGEGIAVFAKVLGIAAKDDTADEAMTKMKEAGLVDINASIDRDMSRVEFAHLLGKALGVEVRPVTNPADYPFADFDGITPEDRGVLKALYDLGIFKGYLVDGVRTFRPGNILTRAELAILVDRILGAH